MSKYKSPFSLGYRKPLVVTSDDPRANNGSVYSRYGREIYVQDKTKTIKLRKYGFEWISKFADSAQYVYFTNIKSIGNIILVGGGNDTPPNYGAVFKSTDVGETWTQKYDIPVDVYGSLQASSTHFFIFDTVFMNAYYKNLQLYDPYVPMYYTNIYSSTDGETWTLTQISAYSGLYGSGNGKVFFEAKEFENLILTEETYYGYPVYDVTLSDKVYTSNNDGTFTKNSVTSTRPIPGSGNNSYAYGNNKYVAVNYGGEAWYSENLLDWIASSGTNVSIESVRFINNKFIGVSWGWNQGAISTDGITWDNWNQPDYYILDIGYTNGVYMLIGSYVPSYYSYDMITWTALALREDSYVYQAEWEQMLAKNNRLIAVGFPSTQGNPSIITIDI